MRSYRSKYMDVPQTLQDNLEWRILLRDALANDRAFRRAMQQECARDFLLFCNAFCWLYEPRPLADASGKVLPQLIPFLTWPHQEREIKKILGALGNCDIGVEKSRGEGFSWIGCTLALWEWVFHPLSKIGLVSRTESMGDNPENPDSLFWKIDFQLSKMPLWLVGRERVDWKRNTTEHWLVNLRNGSRITSEAATGAVGRGGRCKWHFVDELAFFPRPADSEAMSATQQNTYCRFMGSTPNGQEGEYFELMHRPSSMIRCVLDWKDNPTRNRGMYRYEKGRLVLLDPKNPLPPRYESLVQEVHERLLKKGFSLEGTIRSPWYDWECDRASATPTSIARELDRDYGGALSRIFDHQFQDAATETCRGHTHQGRLDFDANAWTDAAFHAEPNGMLRVWMPLDATNRPRRHGYVVGVDICAGLAGEMTSNSVAQVIDTVTLEQVAELVTNTVIPTAFADMCIALCFWLHGAYLIWERNGPGQSFTKQVLNRKYRNIYFRKDVLKRSAKRTKEPGWLTTKTTKEASFGDLDSAVKTGQLLIRSRECRLESQQYVRIDGEIEHVQAKRSKADSSKGHAHGDRIMALAMAYQGVKDRPVVAVQEVKPREIPAYSMAARLEAWEKRERERSSETEWDTNRLFVATRN